MLDTDKYIHKYHHLYLCNKEVNPKVNELIAKIEDYIKSIKLDNKPLWIRKLHYLLQNL